MDNARWTWLKTETGYAASDGRAELVKVGKAWLLRAHGTEVAMPRRASFDHAERALAAMETN